MEELTINAEQLAQIENAVNKAVEAFNESDYEELKLYLTLRRTDFFGDKKAVARIKVEGGFEI